MSVTELVSALESVPLLPLSVANHHAVLVRLLPQVQQSLSDADNTRLAKALAELERVASAIPPADRTLATVNQGLSRYKFWNSVVSTNPVPAVRTEAQKRLGEIADDLVTAAEVAIKKTAACQAKAEAAPDHDATAAAALPACKAAPPAAASSAPAAAPCSPPSPVHSQEQPPTPDAPATHPKPRTPASPDAALAGTAARQAAARMPPTWLTSPSASTPAERSPSPRTCDHAPVRTQRPTSTATTTAPNHHPPDHNDTQTPGSASSHSSVAMWIPNALLQLPEHPSLGTAHPHAALAPHPTSTGAPSLHTPAHSETPLSPLSSTTHTTHPDHPPTPALLSQHATSTPHAPLPRTPHSAAYPSSLLQFNDAFEADNSDEELDSVACNFSSTSIFHLALDHPHLPSWASAPDPSSPACGDDHPAPHSPLGPHRARSQSDLLYFQSHAAPLARTAIDTHNICLALVSRDPSVTLPAASDSVQLDASPARFAAPAAAVLPPTAHPITPSPNPTPNPSPLAPALATTTTSPPTSPRASSLHTSPWAPCALNPRLPFISPRGAHPSPRTPHALHSTTSIASSDFPSPRTHTSLFSNPANTTTELYTAANTMSTGYYSIHSLHSPSPQATAAAPSPRPSRATTTATHDSPPLALASGPYTATQLAALAAASSQPPSTPSSAPTPPAAAPPAATTSAHEAAARVPSPASPRSQLQSSPSTSSDWRIQSAQTAHTVSPAPSTLTNPTSRPTSTDATPRPTSTHTTPRPTSTNTTPHPTSTDTTPRPAPLPRDDSARAPAYGALPSPPALPTLPGPPTTAAATTSLKPLKPRPPRSDSAMVAEAPKPRPPRSDSAMAVEVLKRLSSCADTAARAGDQQASGSRANSSTSNVVYVEQAGPSSHLGAQQPKQRRWSLRNLLHARKGARGADSGVGATAESKTPGGSQGEATTPHIVRRLHSLDSTHSTPSPTPRAASATTTRSSAPAPSPRLLGSLCSHRASLPDIPQQQPPSRPPPRLSGGSWIEEADELVLDFCTAHPTPRAIPYNPSPRSTLTRDPLPLAPPAPAPAPTTDTPVGAGSAIARSLLSAYAARRSQSKQAAVAKAAEAAATRMQMQSGSGAAATAVEPRRLSLTQYAARLSSKVAGKVNSRRHSVSALP